MDERERDIAKQIKKVIQSEDLSNEPADVGRELLEIVAEIIVGLVMEGDGE